VNAAAAIIILLVITFAMNGIAIYSEANGRKEYLINYPCFLLIYHRRNA
jgi:hypothetical protein